MTEKRRIHFKSKCSLIVILHDTYSGEPPLGSDVSVQIEDIPIKPLQKAEKVFVYSDLPPKNYRIHVRSSFYFDESFDVDLNQEELTDSKRFVKHVALIPTLSYPVHTGMTMISATFLNDSGDPMAGVNICAVPKSDDCYRARFAQEVTKQGSKDIYLAHQSGPISVGEQFVIVEKNDERREYCQIADVLEGARHFELADPLQENHYRGALLLPVTMARSNENGEVAFFFRGTKVKQYDVELQMNYFNKNLRKEVSITNGKMEQLGSIVIQDSSE